MERVIKVSDLPPLDNTSVQILRVISLKLGENREAYVDYNVIAASLDMNRKQVSSSVKRMEKKGVLCSKHGKISIPVAFVVEE